MTEDKKRILQERVAALHEKYCKQLPGKYHDIEESWREYQTDFSSPVYIEKFYRLIHTLKGTAATFGFNKQADICFDIQKLLIDAKENNAVLAEDSTPLIDGFLIELKTHINTPADDIGH
ncbi:MAG: Hpt domain-containing protein [Woeseiaceae bacterium]